MPSIAIVNDPTTDTWYEYLQVQEFLSVSSIDDVTSILGQIETKVETQGWYAVGYVSYEAAPAFDRSLPVRAKPKMPLVCFGLFKSRRPMIFSEHLAPEQSSPWLIDIGQADYRAKLEQLDRGIRAGDYYQVNYTTRCRAKIEDGWAMFQRLRLGARHGAYLNFENFEIVSASPELFFSLRNKTIVSKPMKGTVSRGQDEVEDESNNQWLLHSSKNRAENLMITDMVRNDMARIPGVDAIRVPELFSIEKYPTVWQMTSTVQATTEVGVTEIFRAMFPAASITGAPKQASMKYIVKNEDTPREVYTGAIGVIAPNRQAHFNVAIRTAIISKDTHMASFGVGGGVVADSQVAEEYLELLAKTQLLAPGDEGFYLLETMRLDNGCVELLDRHLTRMQNSAKHFSYGWSQSRVAAEVVQVCNDNSSGCFKLRLLLDRLGGMEVQITAIDSILSSGPCCGNKELTRLALANMPVNALNPLLYHKTTHRKIYECAAADHLGYEVLLYNQQGNITESTIANVVYEWQGVLYTPPVADGLLPGTLRSKLLEEGVITERSLHLDDCQVVSAWYLVNGLRGWRDAQLDSEQLERTRSLLSICRSST